MLRRSAPNAAISAAALVAVVLAFVALAGCTSSAAPSQSTSQTPVTAPVVISGTLPGVQVVEVSKLSRADQQAIAAWVAAGGPADKVSTLATGTYTPAVDGHLLVATKGVGSQNGIAVSEVTLQFDPDGTKQLGDFTTAHPGATIAVVVGGRVVMTADPADPITDGQIVIDGSRELIDSIAKQIVVAK
ncbi:MAG: hypothetical protein P4L93_10280 [Coriobacteriia bacterium]|nr:hypothetical protein [Coriobacteriia bacterium]